MRKLVTIAAVCFALSVGCRSALAANAWLSTPDASPLIQASSCQTETLNALQSQHGTADPTKRRQAAHDDALFCLYARDALCASTPDAPACSGLEPVGAYGGYYLSRHLMPLVMALRAELMSTNSSRRDGAWLAAGLEGMGRVLDLLDPGLRGCQGYAGLRTWCTQARGKRKTSTSHRYAVAHLASELVLLFAECRERAERCPLANDAAMTRRFQLWFDLLAWDHVLLDTTLVRNSFTQFISRRANVADRLTALSASKSGAAANPFLFQAEGRALAVAANLLAIDRLLSGDDDPRLNGLSDADRDEIGAVVERGVQLLAARRSSTKLVDFEGKEVTGAAYDLLGWDRHPYRRFSAITSSERPFTVTVDAASGKPSVHFAGEPAAMARGIGLDAGHYRRVVWLHYALENAGRVLQRDWSDDDALKALANQYAYAVYQQPCQSGRCKNDRPSNAPPRFANYTSGIDGWYRLVPETPCEPGVPPSGFSLQMMLSENLWWARFNSDITEIWQHMQRAIDDANIAAPSSGDAAPCGANAGEHVWHESYYDVANSAKRVDRYYATAFIAMRRWASFALNGSE